MVAQEGDRNVRFAVSKWEVDGLEMHGEPGPGLGLKGQNYEGWSSEQEGFLTVKKSP